MPAFDSDAETDPRAAALAAIEDARFDEAEVHLRAALARAPQDAMTRAILALVLADAGRPDEADAEAARAVTLEPFLPFVHWVQGSLRVRRGRPAEAIVAAREALALDPEDADHHALLAQCCALQARWLDALGHADRGLDRDPAHAASTSLRALALRALGRDDEAARAFEDAAALDPLDPLAAAGKGWSALGAGDRNVAVAHFRDALLVDPRSEWAREGLLVALRSRNVVYRTLLPAFLKLGRMSARQRLLVAIAGVVAFRVLRTVAAASPLLAIVAWPLMGAYVVFLLATWLADPLLDLAISMDAEGRRLLGPARVRGVRLVAIALAAAIALAGIALGAGDGSLAWLAAGTALLALPLGSVTSCERGWPRTTLAAWCALVAAVLVAALALPTRREELATLALVLGVAGTWLGGWLVTVVPRR